MSEKTVLTIGGSGLFEGTRKFPLKPITLIFGPNDGGKTSLINSFISAQPEYEIQHLRPSLSMGKRELYRDIVVNNIDMTGIGAYGVRFMYIMSSEDEKIRKDFNLYLSLLEIPYELAYDYEYPFRDKRTGTKIRPQDMGTGISQLLPVITSACTSQGQIVVIEHPEAYLHPMFQVGLGDMFIESALGERDNTFILETHSEHLILRLLRRIRENTDGELPSGLSPITPDDITVIYANTDTEGAKLIELRVTEDGDFIDEWPMGFFTERVDELF